MTVLSLDVSNRIRNALDNAGIRSMAELCGMTRYEVGLVRNLGAKSIRALEAAMAAQERFLADFDTPNDAYTKRKATLARRALAAEVRRRIVKTEQRLRTLNAKLRELER